ncbi:MAG: tetratricopeptide repeat protein [Pontixanthobacter sp.]
MNSLTSARRPSRAILSGLALFAAIAAPLPALAQSNDDEVRIRKLEAEVRALQRKVFPGADGRFFEPQISGPAVTAGNTDPASTTAVTDILVRLDALETQIASLTAQTEENGNALAQLSSRVAILETGPQPASGNFVPGTPVDSAATGTATGTAPVVRSTTTTTTTTTRPAAPAAVTVTAPATGPSAARLAAVSQIAKPQTDDAGDDEYSYGFRLWDAGFFPEAQQQLTMFVEKYPSHPRATYGRNLLGRAYLDDGQPADAAPWFLKNYQADEQDARAPDSLLYLAEAMIALDDTNRACIALSEFGESYPALASGRLSDQYQRNVGRVTCN